MDPARHTDKVALVSGAGSGIGRGTVLRLAAEGARVFALDRDQRALDETAALGEAAGAAVDLLRGDVTSVADVNLAVESVVDAAGRLDILANVAGVSDGFQPLHCVEDEMWSVVLDVNLNGPMYLSRRAVQVMRDQGGGSIVNVASVAALGGGVAGVSYTVSKHAVIGLTRSTAWAYRSAGIRCNAVCPGGVATAMGLDGSDTWGYEVLRPGYRLAGPVAQPDQIAALISWLSCAEASNVTGAIVTDDGGWRAV